MYIKSLSIISFGLFAATMNTTSVIAQPVSYQDVIAGCAGYLTVQKGQCTVQHYFICPDRGNEHISVSVQHGDLTSIEIAGPDGEFLDHQLFGAPGSISLVSTQKQSSFSALRADGKDKFEGVIDLDFVVGVFENLDLSIETELTSRTRTINGLTFQEGVTTMSMNIPAAGTQLNAKQEVLIHQDMNALISGRGLIETFGEVEATGSEIIQIFQPGEVGFLSDRGLYDCGAAS